MRRALISITLFVVVGIIFTGFATACKRKPIHIPIVDIGKKIVKDIKGIVSGIKDVGKVITQIGCTAFQIANPIAAELERNLNPKSACVEHPPAAAKKETTTVTTTRPTTVTTTIPTTVTTVTVTTTKAIPSSGENTNVDPIPLYIIPPPGASGNFLGNDKDMYQVSVDTGGLDVGCFTFTNSTLFSPYSNKDDYWLLMSPREYSPPNRDPSLHDCMNKCKELERYTYAGLIAGYEAGCFCFNNIRSGLIKNYCSACLYCNYTRPVNSWGTYFDRGCSISSKRGCKPTKPYPDIIQINTMYVTSTCPQGYYGPPNCRNRVKDTCATVNDQGVALAYANGTCGLCNIRDSGKYSTMKRYCDVLQDNQPVEDYRLSTVVNKLRVNFLVWKDDFSTAVTDTNETAATNFINTKPLPHASTDFLAEARNTRAVSIKGSRDLDPFFMPGKRYYLRHFRFKSKAKGAFYFSLWNMVGGVSATVQRDTMNPYQSNDMVTSFRTQFQLLAKHLIDVNYDDIYTWWDVNLPFTVANGQNPKFGYHSLDSKATWGGTGSMQESSEFNSLVCTTIYASSYTLPDPSNNVYNYKNWNTLDTVPGWGNEKVVLTGRSDRPWWAVHQYEYVTQTSTTQTTQTLPTQMNDHVNNCGLRYTFGHYDDCLFKVMMAVACPDYCLRQQCNIDSSCKFGCVDGVAGTKCDVACPAGKFGQNCDTNCSAGCQSQVCARDTGSCTQGCVAGVNGASCSTPCKDGYFGQGCVLQCSPTCVDPSSCNAVDGTCYGGCIVGYMPPLCREPCDRGTFGPSCDYLCGYCKGRETCNAANGTCRAGCDGSYMPPFCFCVAGTWGVNCSVACGACKNGLHCSVDNGFCLGNSPPGVYIDPRNMCEDGFQPPTCVCNTGTWGNSTGGCPNSCGNCYSGTCMSDTGLCLLGCVPGFQGGLCNDKCNISTWGASCAFTCGACKGGPNTCNAVSGNCTNGCDPGYQQPLCSDCAPGFWGPKCNKTCGYCRNKVPCLTDTGACPFVGLPPDDAVRTSYILKNASTLDEVVTALINSIDSADTAAVVTVAKYLCQDGYEPIMCTCMSGFYGDKCDKKCANCIAGCTENGTCLGGCIAGFCTPSCNTSCFSGFFGPNCRIPCGHCFNNTVCTAEDGICKQGCEPGYMLPKCICSRGYFGDDCKRVCGHCAVGTTCSFLDGSCQSGCAPGWKEPYCNCTIGSYMIDCSFKCGNCAGTNDCDFYSGACQYGCNASYNEPLCVEKCQPGFFGPGCFQTCGKCMNCEVCQPDTGKCLSGCKAGFLEPDCLNPCPKRLYGPQCKQKCGNCINGTCDPVDGICDTGCIMGYLSPYCTQPCPSKTWGFNCVRSCGNCKKGKTCNYLDGTCAGGCDNNYMSPFCVEKINNALTDNNACPEGLFFPPTCITPCGKCKLSLPCNGVSGFCQSGCEPGYEPILCVYPCADGLWGANCLQTCGNCAGTGTAAVCRKTDGMCISGCVDGWFGDTCKYTAKAQTEEAHAAAKNNCCKFGFPLLMLSAWILLSSAIRWFVFTG